MLRSYLDALKGFRRKTAACVVLFAMSGVFESLGIAALLPFMESTIDEGSNKELFGLRGDDLAIAALAVLMVLGSLSAVFRYIAHSRLFRVQADVESSLRSRMTEALFEMRWTAFHRMSFGDTAKSVLVEGESIGRGVNALVLGFGNGLIALVFAVTALVVSLELTAVTLAFTVGVLGVYRLAGRRAQARGRDLSGQSGVVTELANDLFNNYKFYRSTGGRDQALARADSVYRRWAEGFARMMSYQPLTRLGFDVAGLAFIAGVLAVGVVVAGIEAAEAFVFLALFYRLAPKLQVAQNGLLVAQTHSAWWDTWQERYTAALAEVDDPGGDTVVETNPAVVFDHVSFTFPESAVSVLDDVSWRLPAGDCLAVVGESGSGKTTTLDLVTGLLRPTAGTVRLDNVDLADVDLGAWQRRIGFVMQDPPMFFGTVLDNIAFSDPEPDRERAMYAARLAHVAEVIEALPDGLDTRVGLQGSRLSGGQRQRLALARALYGEPWLLVLDEATSALDSESEREIQTALTALKGSLTILLVAHRLKTVELADRIIVLVNGRIAEEGTWSDLAERPGGVFQRMLALQATTQETPVS